MIKIDIVLIDSQIQIPRLGSGFYTVLMLWAKMEDGDMESENARDEWAYSFGRFRVFECYDFRNYSFIPVCQCINNASIYNCSIHDTKKNSGV